MAAIEGILITPMTPFDRNGALSTELLDDYFAWCRENGVSGAFCLGTWGGFPLLSLEERRQATSAFIAAARKNEMSVVVNIGSPHMKDARDLARLAAGEGATAVASTVPIYHSGANYYGLDNYRHYFGELIGASDDTPFFIYNNARTTGVLLTPDELLVLVKDGVSGIKDGGKSIDAVIRLQNLLADHDLEAEIIPGNTSQMLAGRLYGLNAVTSGAAVTFPRLSSDIFTAWDAGNAEEAARLHRLLTRTRVAISKVGHPAMVSYPMLRVMGRALGFAREPWTGIDDEIGRDLLAQLRNIPGIEDYLEG